MPSQHSAPSLVPKHTVYMQKVYDYTLFWYFKFNSSGGGGKRDREGGKEGGKKVEREREKKSSSLARKFQHLPNNIHKYAINYNSDG